MYLSIQLKYVHFTNTCTAVQFQSGYWRFKLSFIEFLLAHFSSARLGSVQFGLIGLVWPLLSSAQMNSQFITLISRLKDEAYLHITIRIRGISTDLWNILLGTARHWYKFTVVKYCASLISDQEVGKKQPR